MDLRLIVAVLRELRRFRAHESWSRSQLTTFQEEALSQLREWTYAHSAFYREFHRGLLTAPLDQLPVLTKREMMDHFDALVTDPEIHLADARAQLASGATDRFRNRYEIVATSGSTGAPGVFLFATPEWATMLASFARAREWAGLTLSLAHRSRMAVVSSTNERNLSARVGKVADTPFLPTLRLDALEPLDRIIDALNRWQPEVLVAYASMASILAEAQAERTLSIRPRAVFTSSEVLTPQMRGRLENIWGNVIFNEYASTETATIAAEDRRHHGMHVFEDLLVVENVDRDNRPVPPGSFGEKLLVTVLFSRTQPLIRYEISDSVRFAAREPRCDLPFQTIESVQGRAEDVLLLRGPGGTLVRIHPNVFNDVMDLLPTGGWQIVQQPDALQVLLVRRADLIDAADVRAQLEAALARQGVPQVPVLVEEVDAIPKAPSGKAPLIKALADRS